MPATIEARRLAEIARAAGLGDSPDAAIDGHRQAIALLGSDEPTPLFIDVLRWQGSVMLERGRTSDAEPLYRRSLELATALRYESGIAHGLNCLAGLAQRRGDLNSATNMLTRALDLAERCDEPRLIGLIQENLGIIADVRGDPDRALAHYRVAERIFESARDQQHHCWLLTNLGYLHARQERYDEADEAFRRALELARARGDLMSEGAIEENRAETRLLRDQPDEAHASIARALEVAEQRRDDGRRAAALKLRGAYERLTGRADAAVESLRYALTLSTFGEDALLGAEILYQFGTALYVAGDGRMAGEVWRAALEAFERISAADWVERVHKVLTDGPTGRYL